MVVRVETVFPIQLTFFGKVKVRGVILREEDTEIRLVGEGSRKEKKVIAGVKCKNGRERGEGHRMVDEMVL